MLTLDVTHIFFPSDAEDVLQKETITMGEQKWTVRPLSQSEEHVLAADPCTVEVRGMKPDTPAEYLSLFFESTKNYGGTIRNLEYTQGSDVALVTFEEQEG